MPSFVLNEAINRWLIRSGGTGAALLFVALLVVTPWLFEQWAIYGLQNRLQKSGVNFSQQLELHIENSERQALRRATEMQDQLGNFDEKAADWFKSSDEVMALRWVNADGQALRYASRSGMPTPALELRPQQSLVLAQANELNKPSFSALYELAGKKMVDLYVPMPQPMTMTLVATIDTSTWTALAALQEDMSEITVEVIPFQTGLSSDKNHLRVNHPLWEGHWTLEFRSRELTADILKIFRPAFGTIALLISGLLIMYLRNHKLRLQAEKEAAEKSRLLERQSRLSMLGEMSASLAHEINQPLAIIANYAVAGQMQLQQTPDAELLQDLLQKIQEQSLRAAQVLVSVRGLLHQGPVQSVLTDVTQILVNLKPHLVQQAAPLNVKVKLKTEPDLLAKLDPILFEQVVLNLFKNSLQSLENTTSPRKTISITALMEEQTLRIAVADTGHGIAPENERKIFDSFFTTKKDGLGIGLNLCRSVIERFQGQLVLRSNGPDGVCFAIELPVASRPKE